MRNLLDNILEIETPDPLQLSLKVERVNAVWHINGKKLKDWNYTERTLFNEYLYTKRNQEKLIA